MNKLSNDALDVLKRIHDEGMIVRSSFLVKYPYYGHDYDDADEMSDADWVIVKRELFSIESKTVHPAPIITGATVIRHYYKDGSEFKDTLLVDSDGEERLVEQERIHSIMTKNQPDFVLNETRTHNLHNLPPYTENLFVSEYLTIERIEMDDYFEEYIGLLDRYMLTNEARELIGAGADN